MDDYDVTKPSAKRRLMGRFMRRTDVKAEELSPGGDYLVTDEMGSRTVPREVFLRNYMLIGQPTYV